MTQRPDTRIVYGLHCLWWDSIDKVGTRDFDGTVLPVCPHCRRGLMEVPSEEAWFANAPKVEAERPGYRAFILWARGRCFETMDLAKTVYHRETGIELVWER